MEELGWLIELRGAVLYVGVKMRHVCLVGNSSEAIRFSRRIDAEMMLDGLLAHGVLKSRDFDVVEHMWLGQKDEAQGELDLAEEDE